MNEYTPPGQRIAVLVVEDHDDIQLLTQRTLERLGCSVETVSTGRAALELLGRRTYDLIFLDCVLPDITGLDVARAIRRQGGAQATPPIIGITADVVRMGRTTCLAAGMNDWIAKPAPRTAYADALARWVPRQF